MNYKVVSTGGTSVEYTSLELTQLLLRHFTSKPRADLDDLTQTLSLFLQRSEIMHRTSAFELLHMGVMLGFHYAVMRKNHAVEVIGDGPDATPEDAEDVE